MSSLHYAGLPSGTMSEGEEIGLSPGPGASASASTGASARDDVRRRSMDSPRMAGEKPVMRRSGTLPSFPTAEKSKPGAQNIDLPVSMDGARIVELALIVAQTDPNDWTSA